MDSDLMTQGSRVSELLLESVAEPAKLQAALDAMTTMMGADIGLLGSGQRSNGNLRSLVTAGCGIEAGQPEELHFSCFAAYRCHGLTQPAGKFRHPRDIARLVGRAAPGAMNRPRINNTHCLAHIDTGADRVCYVGFARINSSAPFARIRVRATESLLPQVRAAYVANSQLETFKAVSSSVMNRFERYHVGVVLVDDSGLVLYHNSCARQILDLSDGLLVTTTGRLATCSETDTAALNAAIRAHLEGDLPDSHFASELLKVARPGNAHALSLAISPYRGGAHHLHARRSSGHAVIMIYNPDRPSVERGSVVSQVFDLNPQESQLVCAIAAGDSLEAIARSGNRSVEAIRSQLKRVFRKTGTSRQTELVKLVLSGPAAMVQ